MVTRVLLFPVPVDKLAGGGEALVLLLLVPGCESGGDAGGGTPICFSEFCSLFDVSGCFVMGAHVLLLLLLPPSPGDKLCCGGGEGHVVLLPVPGSELDRVVSDLLDEAGHLLLDLLEPGLGVGRLGGVHLVDSNDELLHTQGVGEQSVLPGQYICEFKVKDY